MFGSWRAGMQPQTGLPVKSGGKRLGWRQIQVRLHLPTFGWFG
jgi:hypothetical protein